MKAVWNSPCEAVIELPNEVAAAPNASGSSIGQVLSLDDRVFEGRLHGFERREQVDRELVAVLDVRRAGVLDRDEHDVGEVDDVLHERDEQATALLEVGHALGIGAELCPLVVDAGQPSADRATDRPRPRVDLIVARPRALSGFGRP